MTRTFSLATLALAFLPFVAAYAGEGRHGQVLIIEPGRFLTADDRIQLEASGVRVIRELGRDRYLVRRDPVLAATSSGTHAHLVDGYEPPVRRIGVEEALLREGGSARLQVLFYDDVRFEEAMVEIVAAGGELVDPLAIAFTSGRGIDARLSRSAIDALVSGELVQMIRDRPMRLESDNATAAMISRVPEVREELDLTGKGVVASVYEISPMQVTHPEFEDRATGPTGNGETHATHVAGTIGAVGLRPEAKGMAPEVTIVAHVVDLDFTARKQESFTAQRPAVDNNSWSFVVGWNYDSGRSLNWEWWGFTDDFGAYTPDTEELDRLALVVPTLMVYSAGNDNTDSGPTSPPFPHYHGNSDTVWCSSPSGSGNDCTADTRCGTRCETSRHPADGPWTTMSLVGSLKNGLAVGAVGTDRSLASFSSRGPAVDGRVKPEVVAKGLSQFSTTANSNYGFLQGTSMAAPVVTGIGALLTEQWRRSFNGDPRPEYLKTLIIHGTEDLGTPGPDYRYGFGLVDAVASAEVLTSTTSGARRFDTGAVGRDQRWRTTIDLEAGEPVRLTLGWADPANVAYTVPALVNDIDLTLIGPDGTRIQPWVLDPENPEEPAVRGRNLVDNTERIDAEVTLGGRWIVEVGGTGVTTTAAQPFVLVSSHELAPGGISCADPYEPNETAGSASGILPSGRTLRASLCGNADRDFFRFTLDEGGDILASVTTEVPLRLSILSGSTVLGSVDVPAGTTRDLSLRVGSPGTSIPPQDIVVRVEPLSGAEGEYSLRVDWPGAPPALRRGVRR